MSENIIKIYTDGACSGNPGPGGWACIILYPGEDEVVLRGSNENTTNNRMELTAVISALKEVSGKSGRIVLYSDAQYVVKGVDWAKGWRKNDWKKPDGKPALNKEMWEELLCLVDVLDIEFKWVRGHQGDEYNERCDAMAVEESVAAGGEPPAPKTPPAPQGPTMSEVVKEAQQVWDAIPDADKDSLIDLYAFNGMVPALFEKLAEYYPENMSADAKCVFAFILGLEANRTLVKELWEN